MQPQQLWRRQQVWQRHFTVPAAAAAAEPVCSCGRDRPLAFVPEQVNLNFDLNEDVTTVTSTLAMVPNYKAGPPPPLVLNGRKNVELVSIKVAGEEVGPYRTASD